MDKEVGPSGPGKRFELFCRGLAARKLAVTTGFDENTGVWFAVVEKDSINPRELEDIFVGEASTSIEAVTNAFHNWARVNEPEGLPWYDYTYLPQLADYFNRPQSILDSMPSPGDS
jgi:hypothetical protein